MKITDQEDVRFQGKVRDAAQRVDPRKATMRWTYAQTLDPYGALDLPPEYQQVGREYFLGDPEVEMWVLVSDVREQHPEFLDEEWKELMRAAAKRDTSPDPLSIFHAYR